MTIPRTPTRRSAPLRQDLGGSLRPARHQHPRPALGIRLVTLITAFGIAIVKAYLVAKNFMHLNIEKRWVTYILLAMVAFMVVIFGGICARRHATRGADRWHKTFVEPAVAPEPRARRTTTPRAHAE